MNLIQHAIDTHTHLMDSQRDFREVTVDPGLKENDQESEEQP